MNFKNKTKPQNLEKKQKKDDVLKILEKNFLMLLTVKYFQ